MTSVGRQLCKTAIDAAADLRRYAALLEDFAEPSDDGADLDLVAAARMITLTARELARRLEELVPPVLDFEGELRPALVAARRAEEELGL